MTPPTISVLVLTYNSQKYLAECLASCVFADEIVVLDSFSHDQTLEIAHRFTTRVVQRKFTNFLEQRLFGLAQLTGDWVLMLDSDETLDPALPALLRQFSQQHEFGALALPRRNYLLGQWVQHAGWYPDFQTRFIRGATLQYDTKIVHERFYSSEPTQTLPAHQAACLHHQTCDDLAGYVAKMNQCTTLEAAYYQNDPAFKVTKWGIFTRSFGMFTQTIFHHRGYRDGMPGFVVACFNLIYSLLLMLKIWDLRRQPEG